MHVALCITIGQDEDLIKFWWPWSCPIIFKVLEMFEQSAYLRPHVQTTSSGPSKCLCMKKYVWSLYSYIDTYLYSCLNPLSNEWKSMFKLGDSHAVWTWVWNWRYLKRVLHYLHDLIYEKCCGPDWSFCRCFCLQKCCVKLWRCDDVIWHSKVYIQGHFVKRNPV